MSYGGMNSNKSSSRSCSVAGCDSNDHLFSFPKNEKLNELWCAFIRKQDDTFTLTPSKRVCNKHFNEISFKNYKQFEAGLATKLLLDSEAVPSIPSKNDISMSARYRRAIVREVLKPMDNNVPKTSAQPVGRGVSVGTQTGKLLLKSRRRSKYTQCCLIDEQVESSVKKPDTSLECESEPEEDDTEIECQLSSDDSDSDYSCSEAESDDDCNDISDANKQPVKVIVDFDHLLEAFKFCIVCASVCSIEGKISGAAVKVNIQCLNKTCNHSRTWYSSASHERLNTINGLVCGAILFNGALPMKVLRTLSSIGIKVPSYSTYQKYQKNYLWGILNETYLAKQEMLRTELSCLETPIHLAGDGRYNSMGHSAVYGLYTLMESESQKIIVSELVKVTETTSSNAMELEGLERCLTTLENADIQVSSITTDRHRQITAYLKESQPSITHMYDRWHIGKSLGKHIREAGKTGAMGKLNNWSKAVINHFYKVVDETPLNSVLREEMWLSVVKHCSNIHSFPENKEFKECQHEVIEGKTVDGKLMRPDWMLEGGRVASKLYEIVSKKELVAAIQKASVNDTTNLESFHSELNRNAPKMSYFPYHGMKARCQLTILHHNENCGREVAIKKDGGKKYHISRKKQFKQHPTMQEVKVSATYKYREELLQKLVEHLQLGTKPANLPEEPATLASTGPQISREELVLKQQSRPGMSTKRHYVEEPTSEECSRGRPRKKQLN